MIEIRVLNVEYRGKTAHVRCFRLAWDKDRNVSLKPITAWPNVACQCCHHPSTIMIKFDGTGWVCQRCLFQYLADKFHQSGT